jgi:cell division transport system ATP-binding protein
MATRNKLSRRTLDRAQAASNQHPRTDTRQPRTARPVIEFRNVSKLYAGDVGLDQATFSIERGEFVFLVGSTGSGKSTVMRLLIKELEATSGMIRVAGKVLDEIPRKRVPFYRRNVGVVFQDFKLLPNRTVYDNVAYALQVTGGTRKEIRAKVPDILRLTGLSTKLHLKELDASSGNLIVGGRSLPKLKRSRVPILRRNIGCVFQDFKLLPNRTVYQNVAYALQVQGKSRAEIRKKVPDIIGLVGLADKGDRFPHELSGGEQQRVSVARAFVNHPPLLLADEPTGNLDPETSIDIMRLLYRINRTGTTVLVATHDQSMVDKMRRRVLELSQGRIVRDEAAGMYTRDETTRDLARRLRAPAAPPPGLE